MECFLNNQLHKRFTLLYIGMLLIAVIVFFFYYYLLEIPIKHQKYLYR